LKITYIDILEELPDPVSGHDHESVILADLILGDFWLPADPNRAGDQIPNRPGHGEAWYVFIE
jgi:hypothetical protein